MISYLKATTAGWITFGNAVTNRITEIVTGQDISNWAGDGLYEWDPFYLDQTRQNEYLEEARLSAERFREIRERNERFGGPFSTYR